MDPKASIHIRTAIGDSTTKAWHNGVLALATSSRRKKQRTDMCRSIHKIQSCITPLCFHRRQWMGSKNDALGTKEVLQPHLILSSRYIKGYPFGSQGADINKPIALQLIRSS